MLKKRTAVKSYPDLVHPNEVITFKKSYSLETESPWNQSADTRVAIPGSSIEQAFNFDEGDHLLIAVAGVFNASGSRYSNYWQNDTVGSSQFFQGAPGELTIAPHGFGFNENSLTGDNGLYVANSYGFGHRCFVGYIDRENGLGRYANVNQDVTEPYQDTFAAIASLTQGAAWDDSAIGTVSVDFGFNSKFVERGSIRAIKWTSGNAPPIAVIETAIEWMYRRWADKNNSVIYPPLVEYQI